MAANTKFGVNEIVTYGKALDRKALITSITEHEGGYLYRIAFTDFDGKRSTVCAMEYELRSNQ